jgi:hypothetical protein
MLKNNYRIDDMNLIKYNKIKTGYCLNQERLNILKYNLNFII